MSLQADECLPIGLLPHQRELHTSGTLSQHIAITKNTPQKNVLVDTSSQKNVLVEDTSQENVLAEDTSQENVLAEDTSQENVLAENTSNALMKDISSLQEKTLFSKKRKINSDVGPNSQKQNKKKKKRSKK